MRPFSLILLVSLGFVAGGCGDGQPELPSPDADNGGITLPEGFGALVVADELGRARHLVVRGNGDIYVNLRRLEDDRGIVALRDTTGDGRADVVAGVSGVHGTGIEIHDGNLYFASDSTVYRMPLDEEALVPTGEPEAVVTIPHQGGHTAKTFTFDHRGGLYVNVGSFSNACQEEPRSEGSPGQDPCLELGYRAGIWRFSDARTGQGQEDGTHYATGIRNAVALVWNDEVDALFAVQHGRDDLHRFWPELYTEDQNVELPAEEFLRVGEGDDFGWPYCYYDSFKEQKLLNPEYGGDGSAVERCSEARRPLLGFPGHWAPNDLLFYTGNMFPERYRHGAFVAFHGSWNRLNHEQAGFNVVFIPMQNGVPSGQWEVFAQGFAGPRAVTNPGDALYRPVGLAQGPDGSLYISDSQRGRIWRVVYYPEGIPVSVDSAGVRTGGVGQGGPVPEELAAGKAVYDRTCLACHQANGNGVPGMNPPLSRTEYVLGDKTRLIGIVLNGMSDPIEIRGETYQNTMASHAFLTDQEIADVLTYVRKSFGNDADPVLPEEVAKVRGDR